MNTKPKITNLTRKIVMWFSLLLVFLGVLILLPAGTFNYWQAYLYILCLIIPMTFVLFYFLKNDPQFLERRIKTKEKEKTQRIIQSLFTLLFLSAYIVADSIGILAGQILHPIWYCLQILLA